MLLWKMVTFNLHYKLSRFSYTIRPSLVVTTSKQSLFFFSFSFKRKILSCSWTSHVVRTPSVSDLEVVLDKV
jgi:hypothetical protein